MKRILLVGLVTVLAFAMPLVVGAGPPEPSNAAMNMVWDNFATVQPDVGIANPNMNMVWAPPSIGYLVSDNFTFEVLMHKELADSAHGV
ncbi:MAG: hypothetical protein KW806_03335, partial [Candidatus Yanofskybacteria bacterium]|nr:hypothetical protein [Candidatus Yanofskybacteria bacterium]